VSSSKGDGWDDESWAEEKDVGIPEVLFVCIRVHEAAAHRLQITVHEKDGLRVVFAFEVDKSPKTVCEFALFDRLSARLLKLCWYSCYLQVMINATSTLLPSAGTLSDFKLSIQAPKSFNVTPTAFSGTVRAPAFHRAFSSPTIYFNRAF
jgi:hypothetical protein